MTTIIIALVSIFITHHFTKKRKIDELVFSARREAYTEFMRNFGMAFGPEKIDLQDYNNLRAIETDYQRNQRINLLFAQCRLLAGRALESKLRHLYDLVKEDAKSKNLEEIKGERERDFIGYEIEALMRYDLHVIGYFELIIWRIMSFFERRNLKKNI